MNIITYFFGDFNPKIRIKREKIRLFQKIPMAVSKFAITDNAMITRQHIVWNLIELFSGRSKSSGTARLKPTARNEYILYICIGKMNDNAQISETNMFIQSS